MSKIGITIFMSAALTAATLGTVQYYDYKAEANSPQPVVQKEKEVKEVKEEPKEVVVIPKEKELTDDEILAKMTDPDYKYKGPMQFRADFKELKAGLPLDYQEKILLNYIETIKYDGQQMQDLTNKHYLEDFKKIQDASVDYFDQEKVAKLDISKSLKIILRDAADSDQLVKWDSQNKQARFMVNYHNLKYRYASTSMKHLTVVIEKGIIFNLGPTKNGTISADLKYIAEEIIIREKALAVDVKNKAEDQVIVPQKEALETLYKMYFSIKPNIYAEKANYKVETILQYREDIQTHKGTQFAKNLQEALNQIENNGHKIDYKTISIVDEFIQY